MFVWLVVLLGAFTTGGATVESLDGTWKVREPLRIEVAGEICEVRRGVAHLTQTGSTLSGTYDAEFACWSPYAPRVEWSPRHGELLGQIDGVFFEAQLFIGDPFPIHLEGTIENEIMVGSFQLGELLVGSWSAAKLSH